MRQSSESLAGRIAYHDLPGLSLREVGNEKLKRLWLRGGFPRAFTSRTERESLSWRDEFMRSFLERDIRQFGIDAGPQAMHRFWMMLAHCHGQLWNSSEIGRSMGLADTTVRHYLDRMADAFVMRQLQPWHENLNKRQVRAPKIYVRDSGLLHALLESILSHNSTRIRSRGPPGKELRSTRRSRHTAPNRTNATFGEPTPVRSSTFQSFTAAGG